MPQSLLGRLFEVDVGAVAHGGHCVARLGDEHGRVVFVRHALPGERVRVRITDDTGKAYCRGDAVEVLAASPARVVPPCPYAGPGRCGGCDWQHAAPAYQRALKGDVVTEQLQRLGGLSWPVTVEEVPGGALGWRTRIQYAVDADGAVGLRRHRSHSVQPIARCLIGAPGVGDAPELDRRWPGASGIDVAIGDEHQRAVAVSRPVAGPGPHSRRRDGRAADRRATQRASTESATAEARSYQPGTDERGTQNGPSGPRARRTRERSERVAGPPSLTHSVDGHRFDVTASGFWQVHPAAAQTLTSAVRAFAGLRPGDSCLDLYAGAGLFSAALADAVGNTGRVVALESDATAVADAAGNLAEWPWAEVRREPVSAAAVQAAGPVDVVVLDPPRSGAGREVLTAIINSGARAVVYVACDPAALARDVRTAAENGWRLTGLRAFDLFPMTQHIECVALLEPAAGPPHELVTEADGSASDADGVR